MVIKNQYGEVICVLVKNEFGYWSIPDGDYPFPCEFNEGDMFVVVKNTCYGCKCYNACGDTSREEPCKGYEEE